VAFYLRSAARRVMPSSATSQALGGSAAYVVGEFEEALAAYRAAARIAPSAENQLALGTFAADIGEANLAQGSLREAIAAGQPYKRAAAIRLFEDLVESRNDEAALQLAREVGWVDPDPGRDYCQDPAPEGFREIGALLALILRPTPGDCVFPAAVSLTEAGLVNLARRLLTDLISKAGPDTRESARAFLRHRLPPHDVVKRAEALNIVAYNLQYTYRCSGLAVEAYERAITSDPQFSWPYSNIGQVYLEQHDLRDAFEWFRKAVDINPNHWKAQRSLGWVALTLGRYDDALPALRQGVELNPADGWGHLNLGRLLLSLNKEDEAHHELDVAVRLDPRLSVDRATLERGGNAGP
jgi:tetratricopeptide (TPR) repeat protein